LCTSQRLARKITWHGLYQHYSSLRRSCRPYACLQEVFVFQSNLGMSLAKVRQVGGASRPLGMQLQIERLPIRLQYRTMANRQRMRRQAAHCAGTGVGTAENRAGELETLQWLTGHTRFRPWAPPPCSPLFAIVRRRCNVGPAMILANSCTGSPSGGMSSLNSLTRSCRLAKFIRSLDGYRARVSAKRKAVLYLVERRVSPTLSLQTSRS
jgi:hypothetical protein